MNLSCNIHAASFVKNGEQDEYDDVSALQSPLGITGAFTFIYDYPLSREAKFIHPITPDMNGEDILVIARSDYETIYKDEEAAAGHPGYIPGMLNRSTSAGPYGIWGHDFNDLYFEAIQINTKKMEIEFGMGS